MPPRHIIGCVIRIHGELVPITEVVMRALYEVTAPVEIRRARVVFKRHVSLPPRRKWTQDRHESP